MKNYTLLTQEERKQVIKSMTDMSITITSKTTEWKRVENKYKHLHKAK
jgi:hypothetical protein